MKFRKFYSDIPLLYDEAWEQETRFLLIIFIDKNQFKKGKHKNLILRKLLNSTISLKYFTVA